MIHVKGYLVFEMLVLDPSKRNELSKERHPLTMTASALMENALP